MSTSRPVMNEVYEESGYDTDSVKLLALYDRARHKHTPYPFATYMLFFLCELTGGSPLKSVETDMVAFFGRNELPELSPTESLQSRWTGITSCMSVHKVPRFLIRPQP